MDLNVIEKVLYACFDVHNVKVVDMTIFREEEYQKIIECDLSVAKQVVPIVVAVPQNWQRTLIDIYIAQHMTFPFIPHVDIKGKFCLFETEGILIDQNLCGIILQSIERAKEIIEDGLAGTNREEFIEEFESYWLQLPSIRLAKVDVVGIQHIGVVKLTVGEGIKNLGKIFHLVVGNPHGVQYFIPCFAVRTLGCKSESHIDRHGRNANI